MKQLKKYAEFMFTALVILAIAACANLGMQQPDTFNKKVAVAYTTVTAVAESATTALKAGKLSTSDANNVVTTSKAALAAIDVAVAMSVSNPTGANDKLTSTLAILTALQAYLAAQGVK